MYIMYSLKIKGIKKMAYNRSNKNTKIYHLNNDKIKKIQNFQKKFWKDWADLYMAVCCAYDTAALTDEEFYDRLKQIFGSKRYKGRELKLSEEYKLYNCFKKVYYRTTTKQTREMNIHEYISLM